MRAPGRVRTALEPPEDTCRVPVGGMSRRPTNPRFHSLRSRDLNDRFQGISCAYEASDPEVRLWHQTCTPSRPSLYVQIDDLLKGSPQLAPWRPAGRCRRLYWGRIPHISRLQGFPEGRCGAVPCQRRRPRSVSSVLHQVQQLRQGGQGPRCALAGRGAHEVPRARTFAACAVKLGSTQTLPSHLGLITAVWSRY